MAYGQKATGRKVPIIDPEKTQAQAKFQEAQAQQIALQTRSRALDLAIQATPEGALDDNGSILNTSGKRDSLIFTRALHFEQFLMKGRDALKFTDDDSEGSTEKG